ncbi:unnamed protein product [Mytilus coruscus]|uniref:C2H2-type domain-containing protein n=1 Tax=Mytilus coruscus TaxID=42192 RepID=A0A6J8CLR6_MYTCO|nr:unnamed protein product [Mytilus coruscus]
MPNTKKTPRKVVFTQVLEEKLQCPFCPLEFGNKEGRNRHLIECTDSRLFCELCSYNTNKRTNLTRHFKKFHCSTDDTDESEDTEAEVEKPEERGIFEDTVKLDNSKSLFTDYDDISSDEYDDDIGLTDKPSELIVSQPKKPVDEIDESVNMGRIFRKKTDPMPIIAPKKRKTTTVQDLKTKLVKTMPGITSINTATLGSHKMPQRCQCNCNLDNMKTVYVKTITKYLKDGKQVKVVEKKVPK